MVRKPRRLFLYLAIVCFAGLVAIFVVDGYLGIYDTLYITVREYEEKIEADFWERYDNNVWYTGARAGEKIAFRYEIENHQFSTYSTHIRASVWQENEKVIDLFSEDKSIEPFDDVTVEWTLSSEDLEDASFEVGEYAQYTVRISYGNVERRIIVDFYYSEEGPDGPYPIKVPPLR